ncbi:UNVERIFIED_CONTAM: hypothetical protein Sradi_3153000 [Sesamum radiatum]|uniref:RNase H type-1 domain-containing protein n=1 Tax=Sesamum radiatum TaxID=300843 RepID=A0AAW2REX2_SESRA
MPVPLALAHLNIVDLINPSCYDWRVDLVKAIFWPFDSACILAIPFSRLENTDQLIWHYSKNGVFSVRSAYQLTCLIKEKPCSSSRVEEEALWWHKMWQAKFPNKAPSLGTIKINFDGTTFDKGAAMGIGTVARDFSLVRHSGNSVANYFVRSTFGFVEGGSIVPPTVVGLLSSNCLE